MIITLFGTEYLFQCGRRLKTCGETLHLLYASNWQAPAQRSSQLSTSCIRHHRSLVLNRRNMNFWSLLLAQDEYMQNAQIHIFSVILFIVYKPHEYILHPVLQHLR